MDLLKLHTLTFIAIYIITRLRLQSAKYTNFNEQANGIVIVLQVL